jgi:hypothetical protein
LIRSDPFNDAGNLPTWTIGMSQANTKTLSEASVSGLRARDVGIANGIPALQAGFISSAAQTFNATSRTSGFVGGATNGRKFSLPNYSLYFNDS